MAGLIPFITVRGAQKAIDFYKEVFQAELIGDITYLNQFKGFEHYETEIGHSTIDIDGDSIFINDYLEEYPLPYGDQVQLVVDLKSEERLRDVFDKLTETGRVVQKLEEVPWGALFGVVKDQFDITWQIYYGHK